MHTIQATTRWSSDGRVHIYVRPTTSMPLEEKKHDFKMSQLLCSDKNHYLSK